jgi:hypothetical protein
VFLITVINSFASNDNNKHFYKNSDGIGSGISSVISDDYRLYQNYPNPFNPVTKLSYKIDIKGYVSLKVYNLVGQVVRVMVDEVQEPGKYSVVFDASDLSTGVYLYKLQVNDFTSVKRMTLIK